MNKRIAGIGYRSKPQRGRLRRQGEHWVSLPLILCLMLLQGCLTYIAVEIYQQVNPSSEVQTND